METFERHPGSWQGSNDFRLMPTDLFSTAPAGATVTRAAGGNLTTIAFDWVHPADGKQSGLLALGQGEGEGEVVAFWADSWHQHPSPRTLLGTIDNGVITVGYEYGPGWWWRIIVDTSEEDALRLQMDNVVPEEAGTAEFAGGAYAAMVSTFTRS